MPYLIDANAANSDLPTPQSLTPTADPLLV